MRERVIVHAGFRLTNPGVNGEDGGERVGVLIHAKFPLRYLAVTVRAQPAQPADFAERVLKRLDVFGIDYRAPPRG